MVASLVLGLVTASRLPPVSRAVWGMVRVLRPGRRRERGLSSLSPTHSLMVAPPIYSWIVPWLILIPVAKLFIPVLDDSDDGGPLGVFIGHRKDKAITIPPDIVCLLRRRGTNQTSIRK